MDVTQLERQLVACDLCGADDGEQVLEKEGAIYVQCRRCGFVYANPRVFVPVDEVEREYESKKENYAATRFSARKQRAYAKKLRAFAKYRKTNRILELGSSVGGFLHRAREMGWQPLGVEQVVGCGKYAREVHGLETITALIEQADLPEGQFDVVYSNAVFEHLLSPADAARRIARALRPGGVVYTNTVNYDSYTRRVLGYDWRLLHPIWHPSLFTPETLSRFFTQAGLEIVKLRSYGSRTREDAPATLLSGIQKSVNSLRARFTRRGDRLVVWAQKPLA